jgi:hypothetical protein
VPRIDTVQRIEAAESFFTATGAVTQRLNREPRASQLILLLAAERPNEA